MLPMPSFSECVLTLVATLGKAARTTDNVMTDLEYDVLDELYFVISFSQLQDSLELEKYELKNVLQALLRKDWIKCFSSQTHELNSDETDFSTHYADYLYLATKAGLLAHHGR